MNGKMLKSIIAALCITFLALTMISCGAKPDEFGLYNNIDDAYAAAQKNNQEMIVVITVAGDDYLSSDVIENVLHSDGFKNDVASNYAVVHIDFGQATYEKTIVNESASKAEQKKTKEFAELMQDNSIFATRLNVQMTPAFFLFSKDEYFIANMQYTSMNTVQEFIDMVEVYKPESEKIRQMVEATKTGTKTEKVAAIDALYEYTPVEYNPFLYGLVEEVLKLDSKNETGLLSKYILCKADMEAVALYQGGDILGASKKYLQVTDNKFLEKDQKQQAYYMAAYLLSIGGTDDYQSIINYLQLAINTDPESPAVGHITSVLNAIQQIVQNGMEAPVEEQQ